MINSRIMQLESNLIQLINSSELPPAIISLILSKTESQVNDLVRQAIVEEKEQADKENIKEKEEIDNKENNK